MTPFFRCAECGDHVKATEYGECAYCGGDAEIIDGESQMIDIIDELERGAMESREMGIEYIKTPPADILLLIAEIRRLRGESKGHRKCPCGGKPVVMVTRKYWVECEDCQCGTDFRNTPEEAWAAWDGVAE